jgi:GTP cyclohydrolase I
MTLSHAMIEVLAKELKRQCPTSGSFYAIPRGGIPVGYMLMALNPDLGMVDSPVNADFFVDDIIDSGATEKQWTSNYGGRPFFALLKRGQFPDWIPPKAWIHFPWERVEDEHDDSIVGTLTNRLLKCDAPFFSNDNIASYINDDEVDLLEKEVAKRAESLLRSLLIDVDRDHNARDTAKRMAKMYLREVFRGRYEPSPPLTSFPNAKALDEMYITGPVTIRSTCAHHLVPIVGRCWIGVVPGERVIGLSKFNRVAQWIASRPQIQEEMVVQIADALEKMVSPKGIAVVVEASHMCMTWRGVQEHTDARMTTNVMRGVFRTDQAARAEFLAMVAKA